MRPAFGPAAELPASSPATQENTTSVAPNVTTTETVAEAEGDDPPISEPTGEPTVMSDVANKDVVDATRELQASGLEVSIQFVSDDRVPYGVTTPTDEHPGDTVHKGESIILSVRVRDPGKAGYFELSNEPEFLGSWGHTFALVLTSPFSTPR